MGPVPWPGPPCYLLESSTAYPASLLKGNERFEGSTDSCSGNTKSGSSLRLHLGRGLLRQKPVPSTWSAGIVPRWGSWSEPNRPALRWAREKETSYNVGTDVLRVEKHAAGDAKAKGKQE